MVRLNSLLLLYDDTIRDLEDKCSYYQDEGKQTIKQIEEYQREIGEREEQNKKLREILSREGGRMEKERGDLSKGNKTTRRIQRNYGTLINADRSINEEMVNKLFGRIINFDSNDKGDKDYKKITDRYLTITNPFTKPLPISDSLAILSVRILELEYVWLISFIRRMVPVIKIWEKELNKADTESKHNASFVHKYNSCISRKNAIRSFIPYVFADFKG